MAIEAQVIGNLVNRLRVIDWVTQHPEVRDERSSRPSSCSGSRAPVPPTCHDCSAATRTAAHSWAGRPATRVPPPETATFTTDPRIEEARAAAEMLDVLNPEMKAIH